MHTTDVANSHTDVSAYTVNKEYTKTVFLNRRALALIIPGREKFSWNLTLEKFSWNLTL